MVVQLQERNLDNVAVNWLMHLTPLLPINGASLFNFHFLCFTSFDAGYATNLDN